MKITNVFCGILDRVGRHFTLCLVSLVFAWYGFSYLDNAFGKPIRSDGIGYYLYLPSILLYGDASFNEIADDHYDGFIPGYTGLAKHPETQRYYNKYNAGVAIFTLPFFLAAHAASWMLRAPPGGVDWLSYQYSLDGMSPLYGHVVSIGASLYFLLGCLLLHRFLRKHFSLRIATATIGLLMLGTNLLDVAGCTSFGSHTISFFLFVCFLLVACRWIENPRHLGATIALGVILGAIALVRVPNILIVLALGLAPMQHVRTLPEQIKRALGLWSQYLLIGIIALLVFTPQFLIWKYATGQWVFNSYGARGLPHLASPEIVNVLFSVKKGVFFWTPILALVLPGLFLMKRLQEWRLSIAVMLALQIYVISSAAVWDAGACFGQRYLSEFLVFAAIPFAATLTSLKTPRWQLAAGVFIFGSLAWTWFLLKLYYTREVSIYGLDTAALYDVFWWRIQMIRVWLGS